MSSLVCALGGIQRTSTLYAEYLGDRDPDNYRDLFRDICNAGRRPRLTTTFQLGDFLGRHVRWMSPFMTLYVADFFEAYADLVMRAAPALGIDLCRALIEDLPLATVPNAHDLTPFMGAPGGQRQNVVWARFLLESKDSYLERFSRHDLPLTLSSKEYDEVERRQAARTKCVMTAKEKRILGPIFRRSLRQKRNDGQPEAYIQRRGLMSLEDKRNDVRWYLQGKLLPKPPPYWGEFGWPS